MATIQGVYVALFGRPADPTGLAFFNTATNNGANLNAIGNLASTAEYQARFTGLNNLQIINSIYQSLFGRDADVTGLNFFANQLATGRQTINTIAINILDGATGSDLTTVNNKIAAANLYTAALDTGTEIVAYSGTAAADAGRAFIAGVSATVPTQAQVDASVAAMVANGGVTGSTFTLTTGLDTLNGTAGNDLFVGSSDGAATSTSTLGDSINGGAGIDTVRIVSNATTTAVPTLTNVENLVLVDTVHETRDVSGIAGLTSLTLEGGNTVATAADADIQITVGAGQTLGLTNVKDTGGTTADAANQEGIDIASAAAVTALNLNLRGAGAAGNGDLDLDILGTGVATLNVSSLDANVVSLANTGAALRTVNMTGTGSTTVTAIAAGVTTVNASTASGAVNVNASGITSGAFAFTGGAGNDTITFSNDALTTIAAGTQLNGGAGTDKIGLFDTALSGTEVARLNAVTGFEVLGLNANITLDAAALTGFKSFSIDTDTTSTISNLQAGSNVAVTASTTALTLAPATGVNAVDLSLTGGVTVGTLTATGLNTLSIASTGTTANAITSLVNSDNSSITVTGTQALTLALAAGTASGSLVNASALTGALTVTGSGLNDVIRGGTAGDTITGGAGADTLTGNAGNDIFAFASTAHTRGATFAVTDTSAANIDKITDFVGNGAAAGDTIRIDAAGVDFTNAATATVTAVTVSTAADFTALAAAVQAASAGVASTTTSAQVYDVTVSGGNLAGRYVIVNDGTAAIADTDMVVSITGVTGALHSSDFAFV